jgi:small subunit ribosomal protein S2
MTEEKNKEENSKTEKSSDFSLDINEMAEAGLYFGHRVSMINPKMKPYTQGCRNNVHIIDLDVTKEKLEEALSFVKEISSKGGTILFVGTKIQVKDMVKEIAVELGFPYVNQRWLGGTFTNFEIIKKRVDYLKDFEKQKEEGGWDKYTKKERVKMQRELNNLKFKFDGLKSMDKLPDAIFVCDMNKDDIVVREAREKGVKVIGISDTNTDPTIADYPIPANDDALSSVKYILNKVKEVILKSKEEKTKSEPKKD